MDEGYKNQSRQCKTESQEYFSPGAPPSKVYSVHSINSNHADPVEEQGVYNSRADHQANSHTQLRFHTFGFPDEGIHSVRAQDAQLAYAGQGQSQSQSQNTSLNSPQNTISDCYASSYNDGKDAFNSNKYHSLPKVSTIQQQTNSNSIYELSSVEYRDSRNPGRAGSEPLNQDLSQEIQMQDAFWPIVAGELAIPLGAVAIPARTNFKKKKQNNLDGKSNQETLSEDECASKLPVQNYKLTQHKQVMLVDAEFMERGNPRKPKISKLKEIVNRFETYFNERNQQTKNQVMYERYKRQIDQHLKSSRNVESCQRKPILQTMLFEILSLKKKQITQKVLNSHYVLEPTGEKFEKDEVVQINKEFKFRLKSTSEETASSLTYPTLKSNSSLMRMIFAQRLPFIKDIGMSQEVRHHLSRLFRSLTSRYEMQIEQKLYYDIIKTMQKIGKVYLPLGNINIWEAVFEGQKSKQKNRQHQAKWQSRASVDPLEAELRYELIVKVMHLLLFFMLYKRHKTQHRQLYSENDPFDEKIRSMARVEQAAEFYHLNLRQLQMTSMPQSIQKCVQIVKNILFRIRRYSEDLRSHSQSNMKELMRACKFEYERSASELIRSAVQVFPESTQSAHNEHTHQVSEIQPNEPLTPVRSPLLAHHDSNESAAQLIHCICEYINLDSERHIFTSKKEILARTSSMENVWNQLINIPSLDTLVDSDGIKCIEAIKATSWSQTDYFSTWLTLQANQHRPTVLQKLQLFSESQRNSWQIAFTDITRTNILQQIVPSLVQLDFDLLLSPGILRPKIKQQILFCLWENQTRDLPSLLGPLHHYVRQDLKTMQDYVRQDLKTRQNTDLNFKPSPDAIIDQISPPIPAPHPQADQPKLSEQFSEIVLGLIQAEQLVTRTWIMRAQRQLLLIPCLPVCQFIHQKVISKMQQYLLALIALELKDYLNKQQSSAFVESVRIMLISWIENRIYKYLDKIEQDYLIILEINNDQFKLRSYSKQSADQGELVPNNEPKALPDCSNGETSFDLCRRSAQPRPSLSEVKSMYEKLIDLSFQSQIEKQYYELLRSRRPSMKTLKKSEQANNQSLFLMRNLLKQSKSKPNNVKIPNIKQMKIITKLTTFQHLLYDFFLYIQKWKEGSQNEEGNSDASQDLSFLFDHIFHKIYDQVFSSELRNYPFPHNGLKLNSIGKAENGQGQQAQGRQLYRQHSDSQNGFASNISTTQDIYLSQSFLATQFKGILSRIAAKRHIKPVKNVVALLEYWKPLFRNIHEAIKECQSPKDPKQHNYYLNQQFHPSFFYRSTFQKYQQLHSELKLLLQSALKASHQHFGNSAGQESNQQQSLQPTQMKLSEHNVSSTVHRTPRAESYAPSTEHRTPRAESQISHTPTQYQMQHSERLNEANTNKTSLVHQYLDNFANSFEREALLTFVTLQQKAIESQLWNETSKLVNHSREQLRDASLKTYLLEEHPILTYAWENVRNTHNTILSAIVSNTSFRVVPDFLFKTTQYLSPTALETRSNDVDNLRKSFSTLQKSLQRLDSIPQQFRLPRRVVKVQSQLASCVNIFVDAEDPLEQLLSAYRHVSVCSAYALFEETIHEHLLLIKQLQCLDSFGFHQHLFQPKYQYCVSHFFWNKQLEQVAEMYSVLRPSHPQICLMISLIEVTSQRFQYSLPLSKTVMTPFKKKHKSVEHSSPCRTHTHYDSLRQFVKSNKERILKKQNKSKAREQLRGQSQKKESIQQIPFKCFSLAFYRSEQAVLTEQNHFEKLTII